MVYEKELYSGFRRKFNDGFLCVDAEEFLAGIDDVDLSMMEDYLTELGDNFQKLYKEIPAEDEESLKKEIVKLTICGVIYEYCRDGCPIEVLDMAELLQMIA